MQIHPLITDSKTLSDFCARMAKSPYVAVDTEFMRETTYWPKLCLAQVAGPHDAAAIDALELQPGQTVVDLGCGTGQLTIPLARLFQEAIGLDLELEMLQEAERVAEAVALLNLQYVVLTAVARDDLADHGASLFTTTMAAIRRRQMNSATTLLHQSVNQRQSQTSTGGRSASPVAMPMRFWYFAFHFTRPVAMRC